MRSNRALAILNVLSLLSTSFGIEDYQCLNKGEGSRCASPVIPGAFVPDNTPQFIVLTVDGAVGSREHANIEKIIGFGHKNPNGAPMPATFFVTTNGNEYGFVQQLHAKGNEIAVQTMTAQTSLSTDYDHWRSEILGCKESLSTLSQIPADEIVGFRAPNLKYNDAAFRVLHDNGFLYDTSITERTKQIVDIYNPKEKVGNELSLDSTSFIWPYTFDNLNAQTYPYGNGPQREYVGLWEVPVWSYYNDDGAEQPFLDYTGTKDEIVALFKSNFITRFNGNRAPLGINLSASWLENDEHVEALNSFLTWARYNNNHVWMVTNHQLIQWIQNPFKIHEMPLFGAVQYKRPSYGEERADGLDNDKDGKIDEGYLHFCNYKYIFGGFHTNAECPSNYPSPVVRKSLVMLMTQHGVPKDIDECEAEYWDKDKEYQYKGQLVTYKDHTDTYRTFRNKWWHSGEEPGWTSDGVWAEVNICRYTLYIQRSTITPPQKEMRVIDGQTSTYLFEPQKGFKIASITINGILHDSVSPALILKDIREDQNIDVKLIEDDQAEYHIASTKSANGGKVIPEGDISILSGTSQTIDIIPDAGFDIHDVIVNGVSLGPIEKYIFSSVTERESLQAMFSDKTTFYTLSPTNNPTRFPTTMPSPTPSIPPTNFPTKWPTKKPVSEPLPAPFYLPTPKPLDNKTRRPTPSPTNAPTSKPSAVVPTRSPTPKPTPHPTREKGILPYLPDPDDMTDLSDDNGESPGPGPNPLPAVDPAINPEKPPASAEEDTPTSITTPITPPGTNNTIGGDCIDRVGFFEARKPGDDGWTRNKKCKWVGRKYTAWRCKKIVGAKEACPNICTNCGMDTSGYFKLTNNNKKKDCEWAKKDPENRCRKPPTSLLCGDTCSGYD